MQSTLKNSLRQRWLDRLLACCGVTLGGTGFEGMWGDALRAHEASVCESKSSRLSQRSR